MAKKQDIKERFNVIKVWERKNDRAPHKPLLLLYALGRCAAGLDREVPYTTVDKDLAPLLKEFGPMRGHTPHTEYPFQRLQRDGIWQLSENAKKCLPRTGHTDARKSELIKHDVRAGFPSHIQNEFQADGALLREVALGLLEAHFPPSLHGDIAEAVGLELTAPSSSSRRRDANFRKNVLRTYGYECAVCGFDVRLGMTNICLDAAHIKWHAAGGPDEECNGLALCTLHHKLFDRGAFTIDSAYRISVSLEANGHNRFEDCLRRFNGSSIKSPADAAHHPAFEFVDWHRREVFHEPARPSVA